MRMENEEGSGVLEGGGKPKVGQEQVYGLIVSEQLSWQEIIYDLINSEQLDPWDIDLVLLSNKYLERIKEMEEANFFISSKVLLAASLLLRIKSEILLNEYIPSLDAILFGEKSEKKYVQERIEFDEEIPELMLRTPLPRQKKVSLQELMAALGKAITTENRRIRKVVLSRQQELETAMALPKKTINLKDQIHDIYSRLRGIFREKEERHPFSQFAGKTNEERVSTFIQLLHLDTQHKVLLEQEEHFDEIWIWLKEIYEKKYANELSQMRKEVEEAMNAEITEERNEEDIEAIENQHEEKIDEDEWESPDDEEDEKELGAFGMEKKTFDKKELDNEE